MAETRGAARCTRHMHRWKRSASIAFRPATRGSSSRSGDGFRAVIFRSGEDVAIQSKARPAAGTLLPRDHRGDARGEGEGVHPRRRDRGAGRRTPFLRRSAVAHSSRGVAHPQAGRVGAGKLLRVRRALCEGACTAGSSDRRAPRKTGSVLRRGRSSAPPPLAGYDRSQARLRMVQQVRGARTGWRDGQAPRRAVSLRRP